MSFFWVVALISGLIAIRFYTKNENRHGSGAIVISVASIVVPLLFTAYQANEKFNRAERIVETNPKEAIDILNSVLEYDPKHTSAIIEKGKAYLQLGNNDEALKFFFEALSLENQNARAWLGVALANERLGNPLEALHACDQSISFETDKTKASEKVAYRKSLLKTYDNASFWFSEGENQYKSGDNSRAISAYTGAIEISGGIYPEARYGRALTYIKLNNFQKANIDLDHALTSSIENIDYWYLKGYSLLYLERYEEALTSLDKAISFDTNEKEKGDAKSWYHKALTQEKLGWYDAACFSYKTALLRDPNYKDAKNNLTNLVSARPSNCPAQ